MQGLTYLLYTSQLVIAGTFAVAAFGKLRAPTAFVASLAGFGLLGRRALRPVAYGVIVAEAAVVPLALVPAIAVVGLALAALLLTVFAVAIAATLRRGLRPRCRCLGAAGAPLRKAHVTRNGALALLAAAGAVVAAAATAPDLEAAPLAVAAIIAAVALIVLATFDDLLAVVSPDP